MPPCANLDDALNSIIENFVTHDIFSLVTENEHGGDTWRQRHMRKTLEADIGWDYDSDDEEDTDYVGPDGKKYVYHMGGSQRLAVGEEVSSKSTSLASLFRFKFNCLFFAVSFAVSFTFAVSFCHSLLLSLFLSLLLSVLLSLSLVLPSSLASWVTPSYFTLSYLPNQSWSGMPLSWLPT